MLNNNPFETLEEVPFIDTNNDDLIEEVTSVISLMVKSALSENGCNDEELLRKAFALREMKDRFSQFVGDEVRLNAMRNFASNGSRECEIIAFCISKPWLHKYLGYSKHFKDDFGFMIKPGSYLGMGSEPEDYEYYEQFKRDLRSSGYCGKID